QPRSSDDRILQDAVAIVSATGLATLSVRALAERNGVNPSLISYRFGSKRGLVSALSESVDGDLKDSVVAGARLSLNMVGLVHMIKLLRLERNG
ncbi:MAG: TetR family transcriptional regulator, partial [Pseudomonadota bacterium]